MTTKDIEVHSVRAHELYGDFWFNSEPVPIAALRGRVILIHFWDFACSHCLRAIPYIREWHKRYASYGLIVVGVHTPKFPFGKNPENVQKAINRLGIEYPVVMDNESLIWSNYGTRFWPSTFVIDKNGFVRHQNFGEGNYGATEHSIQSLLYDSGAGELPLPMEPLRETDKPGAVCYRMTPELFAGYLRGSIGNIEGYVPESVVHYDDPKIYLGGRFYLDGNWLNDRNSLRLNEQEGREGHLILNYEALEVNAVIKPEEHAGFEVVVRQDDQYLTVKNKGDDIHIDSEGRSHIQIGEPRMFNLVKNKEFGEHVLKLSTRSNSFGLYSFTFVSCVVPEMISNN